MKHTIRSSAAVAGCALGLLALPQTGTSQGFYLDVHSGVSLAQDVDLDRFIYATPGAELELRPGPHINLAGGYNFNHYLGLQLETGFINNRIDNLNEPDGSDANAVLTHVPILAGLVFRYEKADSKWVPFAGLSAGGDASLLSVEDAQVGKGGGVDGSAGDVVFAWQAFVGLRYKFKSNMSLGGAYKYYAANGADWEVDNAPGNIETGRATMHTFGVDFTLTF